MRHHKREGSSMGAVKTGIMHGEAFYRTGGSRIFFALKVLHRIVSKPYVVGALSLLWGYLHAAVKGEPLLVTEAEARFHKRLLLARLKAAAESLPKSH